MAIILPTGWNRQPQTRTPLDPKWVAAGLNLALIPHGNSFIDCSAKNVQGTGGVRTAGTCPQGNTVLRTSGNYSFRGLNQNVTTFSRIIVVRQVGTGESVFSCSTDSSTNNSAQVGASGGQIQLVAADQALIATSTGAALANGKTSIIGITYNNAAAEVKFYCDGRILNTVSGSRTFAVDGVGTLFVKPNGGNPFAGGMALHLDFNRILTDAQMVALTTNPWQVFAPTRNVIAFEAAAAGVTGTSATTNANDTSTASGTTTVTGTSATTNANDTSTASGTTTVVGTSATTNANDTSNASGAVGVAITGTSATTNANDTSAASGTTTVTGTSTTTNANDAGAASGTTTVTGTSATTNANDTATASGVAGAATGTAECINNNDVCNASGSTPILQFGGGLSSSRSKRYYIERDGKRIFFNDASEVADLLEREEKKVIKQAKKAIQKITKKEVQKLVTDTGWPDTIDVVVKFKSLPEVLTLPSNTNVAPLVVILNQVAVPVALALASCVIAFNVNTPDAAPGANVALHVSCANSVVAAPPVAGREPS